MVTKQSRSFSRETGEKISAPPGFVSRTSFIVKRVEKDDETSCSANLAGLLQADLLPVDSYWSITNSLNLKKSIVHRPWILDNHCINTQEEAPPQQHDNSIPSYTCLPKGIVRGCVDCSKCQKVTARWRPNDAHEPLLEDAPLFRPTEEEFADMYRYIADIRSVAEPYGICRIVPPPSWQPPCIIKEKSSWESSNFISHIQRVDELRKDYSKRRNGDSMQDNVMNKRTKRVNVCASYGESKCETNYEKTGCCESKGLGFESGPEFNLETFEKYANDFKAQYFCNADKVTDSDVNSSMTVNDCEPSIKHMEGEYWRIVENPTEEIEILHGADLGTTVFCSGFPAVPEMMETCDYSEYLKSDWNLNNVPKSPSSLLSFETCRSSSVLYPRMHIGMCFSSLCWKTEEHHLYSLWYLHLGAPRVWYAVAGKNLIQFQAVLQKYFPNLIEEQPELLYKLVRQLPLSILEAEGIPVNRCIQHPREFVIILPGAYHSGFDCGFNCLETASIAPIDWLPHGQIAVELYRKQSIRTSISHDKLLFAAANEAVNAQWEISMIKKDTSDNLRWKQACEEGILVREVKKRVQLESISRKYLCNLTGIRNMEKSFGALDERVCTLCYCDLHLSAAGCPCSPDRYACLIHAKQMCSCPWSSKIFYLRNDIIEYDVLVEALKGNLTAVHKWAKEKLGLFVFSYVPNDSSQVPVLIADRPSLHELKPKENKSRSSEVSKINVETKPLESSHGSRSGSGSMLSSSDSDMEESGFQFVLKRKPCPISDSNTDATSSGSTRNQKRQKGPSADVIILSDDDDDDAKQ